jgi:hypothetical protein
MSDVVKNPLDVSLDWTEQLADADALEQRATELEQLARQIRTTALRARVRVRRARCEAIAQSMLSEAGVVKEDHCPTYERPTYINGQPVTGCFTVGPVLPNDGPEGNVGGREVSRPAADVGKVR